MKSSPFLDRQAFATLAAGGLLIAISFITNYGHGAFVDFVTNPLDEQIGLCLHLAALSVLMTLSTADSTQDLGRAATTQSAQLGLYNPAHEHDACGVGFVAHIQGRKSHDIIEKGLTILNCLTHRGATGADPLHGDGAGILMQLPHDFLSAQIRNDDVIAIEIKRIDIQSRRKGEPFPRELAVKYPVT